MLDVTAQYDTEKYLYSELKEALWANFECDVDGARDIKVYGLMCAIVGH